jgi:hypothetical protein
VAVGLALVAWAAARRVQGPDELVKAA